jgi:hypothetical protein
VTREDKRSPSILAHAKKPISSFSFADAEKSISPETFAAAEMPRCGRSYSQ